MKFMKNKGFTLIELLTTMAIIAILSGISLFALNGTRESARDGRRRSDLETIRQALEMYKSDCNVYPVSYGTSITGPSGCGSIVYLPTVPVDPQTNNPYCYCPPASGNLSYTLYANLENGVTATLSCSTACSGNTYNFSVTNP